MLLKGRVPVIELKWVVNDEEPSFIATYDIEVSAAENLPLAKG